MAVPTLIRRELKNARIRFIPAGDVVDSVTVSRTTWPDNSPTTNWTNYDFPDIETVTVETRLLEEEFMIPSDEGAYVPDNEETFLSKRWIATTARTNSIIKKLEHVLAAEPVATTPQSPGNRTINNFTDGVVLIEIQNKNGTIIERTQVWARLRLVSPGDIGPATTKVQVSFELRPAALNTYVAFA